MRLSPAMVVTVPGLRGHVEDHWQTRLAASRPNVVPCPPLGRDNPSLDDRVSALQAVVAAATEPVTLVAHSAGVLTTVHWAARHRDDARRAVRAALLATPPDLAEPLPPEYPTLAELEARGWLPIPRRLLPFPSVVAASSNDALGDPLRIRALAEAWGSRIVHIGPVGHLNPASGYGDWPAAERLIDELYTLEEIR